MVGYIIPEGDDTNNTLKWEAGKWTAVPATSGGVTYTGSTSVLIKENENNKIVRAALEGDITAAEDNNITETKLQGNAVSATTPTPTPNQVLTWENNEWKPKDNPAADKSPWFIAGSVTNVGNTGTPAIQNNNAKHYATGAYNTADARIFYSGKLGINVGLKAEELTTHMVGAVNISSSGEQLTLQNVSKAWGLSTRTGDVLIFNHRTLTSGGVATSRLAMDTNGNLVFGDVYVRGAGSILELHRTVSIYSC